MIPRLLCGLARLYPWPVAPSDGLERSLSFLDTAVESATIVRSGYVAGGLVALVASPLIVAVPAAYAPAVLLAVLAGAVATIHLFHSAPGYLAAAKRSLALGAGPGIVARAVLRMRITPTVESAAVFAAETGHGPLASNLSVHVTRARGTPAAGFESFAAEWDEWFPELSRAVTLLATATDADAAERPQALDRALRTVLDGTRDRMAAFANDVQGPTTALYAFGVLLPLALIAVLPAARTAGVPITPTMLVVLYWILLPGIVAAGAGWLLLRRPVAFPPPTVDRSHPQITEPVWRPLLAGVLAGAGTALVGMIVLPRWGVALLAVATGIGTALFVWFHPVVAVRNHARSVESGLVDAMYVIGREVQSGAAVETAIERAAAAIDSETAVVLADGARRQRQLRIDVHTAFLGEYGAVTDLPSPRVQSTAALLALAAREGRPAGGAIVSMAAHLDELATVEADAKRQLGRLTGTLRSTATIFGPLVAGTTVSLAGQMGRLDATGTEAAAIPVSVIGPIVGVYVLLLTTLLTALAVGLEHGLDRPLVGYRVGGALLCAAWVFLTAFVAGGIFV